MRNLRLAALALTCLTVPLAFAQKAPGGLYGELGYTMVTVSPSDAPDFKPSILRAILGYQINSNFSVEGALGMGVSDGTATIQGHDVKLKLSSLYGIYAKAKTELAPGVEAFARAGYTKANSTFAVSGQADTSDSSDGFSWGMGASYAVSPTVALSVDYMSYTNKDNIKATGPTFGVVFKF